jgi:hypothetical protein
LCSCLTIPNYFSRCVVTSRPSVFPQPYHASLIHSLVLVPLRMIMPTSPFSHRTKVCRRAAPNPQFGESLCAGLMSALLRVIMRGKNPTPQLKGINTPDLPFMVNCKQQSFQSITFIMIEILQCWQAIIPMSHFSSAMAN